MLAVLSACKTQKLSSGKELKDSIATTFEGTYESANNADNTMVLVWKEDVSSGTRVVHFGVWEINSARKLYYDSIIQGHVKWMSETELYFEDYKGIVVEGKQVFKYKLDLVTKRKTVLNGKEEL